MQPLNGWSVAELGAAYRAREVSPVEVNAAVASRIAELEPIANALADRSPDLVAVAELAAAESERRFASGMPVGPLDGIPVTVKENLARTAVPPPPPPLTRKHNRVTPAGTTKLVVIAEVPVELGAGAVYCGVASAVRQLLAAYAVVGTATMTAGMDHARPWATFRRLGRSAALAWPPDMSVPSPQ